MTAMEQQMLASMTSDELRRAIERLTQQKIELSRDLIKLNAELIRRNRRGSHDVEHQ